MNMLRALLVALLALASITPSVAADRLLPSPRIKDNGDVRLSDDVTIGRFLNSKYTSRPDAIQILGSGSTGDASGFSVKLPGGIVGTLTDLFAGPISAGPWLVGKTGPAQVTAALQAAITAVAEQGRSLLIPPGDYTVCGLTFNAANGGNIAASQGTVRLKACAIDTHILTVTNMQTNRRPVMVQGLGFDGGGFTGGAGVYAENPAFLNIRNIHTHFIDHAIDLRTTSASLGRAEMISIDGVTQWGQGTIAFRGADYNNLLFVINVSNVRHFSLVGGSPWVAPWFDFKNAINVVVNNINTASLDGRADGLVASERVEGLFVTNAIIVWPKIGVKTTKLAGITAPGWIFLTNVAIDQPSVSGFDIEAYAFKYTNGNVTFGKDQNNTGPGGIIRAATIDWTLTSVQIYGNNYDGLKVELGTKQGSINQSRFTENAIKGGYDLNMAATGPRDPILGEGNFIGTTNVTGQIVNGGQTSRFWAVDRGQTGTPASNGDTTLKAYVVPAGALPKGGSLRVRSAGTFAANGNAKAIAGQIAGVNFISAFAAYNGQPWTMEVEIDPVGGAAWVTAKITIGATVAATYSGILGVDFAAAQTFRVIGANTTSTAGDVTAGPFSVEAVL